MSSAVTASIALSDLVGQPCCLAPQMPTAAPLPGHPACLQRAPIALRLPFDPDSTHTARVGDKPIVLCPFADLKRMPSRPSAARIEDVGMITSSIQIQRDKPTVDQCWSAH